MQITSTWILHTSDLKRLSYLQEIGNSGSLERGPGCLGDGGRRRRKLFSKNHFVLFAHNFKVIKLLSDKINST